MSKKTSDTATLRDFLLAGYDELCDRLARRFGSAERARDILHDAYVDLGQIAAAHVENPTGYIYRAALNIDIDQRRTDARRLAQIEINALWMVAEDIVDPAVIAEARQDLSLFEKIIADLPKRRREILLAARVEDMPHAAIAQRFGISERFVQMELRAALLYCGERMGRKVVRRFGPKGREKIS